MRAFPQTVYSGASSQRGFTGNNPVLIRNLKLKPNSDESRNSLRTSTSGFSSAFLELYRFRVLIEYNTNLIIED